MSNPGRSFHVWACERLLKVRCPCIWEALDPTPQADVHHCRNCDQDVYLCRTPADFVSHGEQGRCVAIPDDLSPSLMLGQSSPEEVLFRKELADRGASYWDEILLRQTNLGAEQIEKIRTERSRLEYNRDYSPKYLEILRMAVRDGSVPCPRCGQDIAEDELGIIGFLATGQCLSCGEPIELELPSE
jgi:hypothetical protein